MNAIWSKFLRSAYRREPITSFIITMGTVNTVIGGIDTSWSLFSLGLGTASVALLWRWWLIQRSQEVEVAPAPELYLPQQSSRPSLSSLNRKL